VIIVTPAAAEAPATMDIDPPVGKRADRKRVRDIVDRAIPADAHMVRRSVVLTAHIRDLIGHVDDALTQLTAAAINDIRLECRLDRRKDGAVQPRIGTTLLIEHRF
jgi:hypothetical protein